MSAHEIRPAFVSPPGDLIREELKERGWTQKYLAEQMDRPKQVISDIINAKKRITPDTAFELEDAFEVPAEFWAGLQMEYDLYLVWKKRRERVPA
ncbi:MAG: HigA family addiction module antidote protein [Thermoleophilia bacterium]|nr:HigA family addiction module antidote protein [Thermoleophilia bacterium]